MEIEEIDIIKLQQLSHASFELRVCQLEAILHAIETYLITHGFEEVQCLDLLESIENMFLSVLEELRNEGHSDECYLVERVEDTLHRIGAIKHAILD